MGEIADASAQRKEHAGKERPAQDYSKHISSSIYTVIGTCSKRAVTKACVDAAVAQFIYATGTTWLW